MFTKSLKIFDTTKLSDWSEFENQQNRNKYKNHMIVIENTLAHIMNLVGYIVRGFIFSNHFCCVMVIFFFVLPNTTSYLSHIFHHFQLLNQALAPIQFHGYLHLFLQHQAGSGPQDSFYSFF